MLKEYIFFKTVSEYNFLLLTNSLLTNVFQSNKHIFILFKCFQLFYVRTADVGSLKFIHETLLFLVLVLKVF